MPMFERPVVHVVDDDEAISKSVSFMLRMAGYDVRVWPTGVAFLKDVRHASPGCVLLDVRMPGIDGLEVQAEMAARGIAMPVIVLTGHGDVDIAVRAMKGGAVDFLEKPFERAVLLEMVETATARVRDADRHAADLQQAKLRIAALTPRERDVLGQLAFGLPNKSIAEELGISQRTVEVHRSHMMAKLGVPSFPDALRIAFAAGLGPQPNGG
jgi:two-component system response regulator FixJ